MKRKALIFIGAIYVVLTVMFLLGSAPQKKSGDSAVSIALTGDSIITRRLVPYKESEYLQMIDLLRSADAAFTNFEMLLHDYEPYPAAESGGVWMRGDPVLAKDLAWAGFDLVSIANNHSGDYGIEGIRLTSKHLNEAGLIHAGTGENLAQAREARYLETAKARISLIALSSSFPAHSMAGRARPDIHGRPGVSFLRHSRVNVVLPEQIAQLRKILSDLGQATPASADRITFMGNTFVSGAKVETKTEPVKQDVEELAASVRDARKQSHYVIVSIHSHESNLKRELPAEFLINFARAMIDAGADIFVGHGPHVLRGVEIYKGKPILYSLGDFMFQNETLLRMASGNYEQFNLGPDARVSDFNDARYDFDRRSFPVDAPIWESVIAVPEFQSGKLVAMKFHPIGLGFGLPRPDRGRPTLADAQLGRKIIEGLAALSAPFGTKIEYRDGIGQLDISKSSQ